MKKHRDILIRIPAKFVIAVFLATFTVQGCSSTSGPVSFLTSPASDEKFPDANGFIQRWLILEPIQDYEFSISTIQEIVKYEYFPDQFTIRPHDGDKVIIDDTKLTWHAFDANEFKINLHYFAETLDKPTIDVLFWAVTIIYCPIEMHGVRLAVGSNARSAWWVNDEDAVEITCDCQNMIDGGISERLTLREGTNIIRCAVVNGYDGTNFWARFLDSNGNPMKGYTVKLEDADK